MVLVPILNITEVNGLKAQLNIHHPLEFNVHVLKIRIVICCRAHISVHCLRFQQFTMSIQVNNQYLRIIFDHKIQIRNNFFMFIFNSWRCSCNCSCYSEETLTDSIYKRCACYLSLCPPLRIRNPQMTTFLGPMVPSKLSCSTCTLHSRN